jgi:hypothetical protein
MRNRCISRRNNTTKHRLSGNQIDTEDEAEASTPPNTASAETTCDTNAEAELTPAPKSDTAETTCVTNDVAELVAEPKTAEAVAFIGNGEPSNPTFESSS